jgi:pimeloyl-ACP methyl ester carboxylesterase
VVALTGTAMSPPGGTAASALNSKGQRIAVWERSGSIGLPIAFLHGNTASKDVFRTLFAEPALVGRRLIAFDLPGCGESDDAVDPQTAYTLPGLSRIVVDVLNQLQAERCILVGWSLGGHIAIDGLSHGGFEPAGVVLTGTPPCGPDPAEIAATFLPVEGADVMSMRQPNDEQIARFLKLAYGPSEPSQAIIRDARRSDGRLRESLFAHIFATPDMEPQRTTIANWPGPFALIQGRDEPFFHPADVDKLAWRKLWRGGTQWIDGAGHAPFVTDPAGYAALLAEFAQDLAGNSI